MESGPDVGRRPGRGEARVVLTPAAARRVVAFAVPVVLAAALLVPPLVARAAPAEGGAREGTAGKVLRWGGDAEGGAPFVEADPSDPSRVRGFDVEIAAELARGLGLRPVFVQVAFTAIDQGVERGDFDVGLSGVELTPARAAAHEVTLPYFEFREVIAVRRSDAGRFRSLGDLRGRRVGTLGGTIAWEMLLEARGSAGVEPVSYDDDVHPYQDLAQGRLDAVLLDNVLADRALRRESGLFVQPDAVSTGSYVGVLAKGSTRLRERVDAILAAMMEDGRLEAIFRRWKVWDEGQKAHFARVLASRGAVRPSGAAGESRDAPTLRDATLRYIPALLSAALVTLVLSCLAMALAVLAGSAIATGRVYGSPPLRGVLTLYVEATRGTPVLLQLFVLYYGLSALVRLDAFVAALLGLGLNYAAYESEVYRSALEAVPPGQLEAARTLGLSEVQVLRLVRAPQAFRLALAPMTNDFVALLKDSSLVSVITVVELTKQTQIFATNVGSWLVPGLLCAGLYLALSLPLARLARRLEARWRVAP